jgi:hypothetical protein
MSTTDLCDLDLSAYGLTNSDDLSSLARVIEAKDLLERAGTCEHPVRLVGGRDVIEAGTGVLLSSVRDQGITVNCGNRRASVCSYCSTLYKYDAYNLLVAGMRGGKDIPADVAAHPRLFVTVTAPSFGPVHLGPDKKGNRRACRPRRDGTGCSRWHRPDDPLIGTPLDPTSYDYTGHVLFNAMASRLWSATLTEIRRSLAHLARLPRRQCEQLVKISFAKVAEYQARGIVHFHAVARLDGPDGPTSAPPTWATADLLDQAIRDAVTRTRVEVPESRALGTPEVHWGTQIDIRPITSAEFEDGELTDIRVARYIAKYATKAAETAGIELPRLTCSYCDGTGCLPIQDADTLTCPKCSGTGRRIDLDQWTLTEHARRLIDTCWLLGGIPELALLRLRRWAHMLGFGGHFATKSRAYSTTFGTLRGERTHWRTRHDPTLTGRDLNFTNLIVINHWAYAGRDDTPRQPAPRAPADLEGISP